MTPPSARLRTPGCELAPAEFAGLAERIRACCGLELGPARRSLLAARLAPRLAALGLDSFAAYLRRLERGDRDGEELAALVDLVTTNRTAFFRESHHFDRLRRQVLPELRAAGRRRVRLWSAGCSTGEEAWSLAMTLADFRAGHPGFGGHVLATDVDRLALERARAGRYFRADLETHAPASWRRHFLEGAGGYGVPVHRDRVHGDQVHAAPALRRLVEFRRANLLSADLDPRPGLDVILCRNVLIHFARETRAAVVARLHDLLRPGGWLFLGHAETLPARDERFVALPDNTWRRRHADEPVGAAPAHAATASDRWPGEAGLRRAQVIVGEVHADARPAIVRTLLGSCVSTCLWDPQARVGGVNHFMLPGGGGEGGSAPRRFGERAMELLLERLRGLGARPGRLRAKVFGGAQVLLSGGDDGVAARNARYALEHLRARGIPVVAQRTGGRLPLEVYFQTHDGRAWVRALKRPR